MADYHVYAGLFGIYAGKTKKNNTEWIEKSEVIDEVLCAETELCNSYKL